MADMRKRRLGRDNLDDIVDGISMLNIREGKKVVNKSDTKAKNTAKKSTKERSRKISCNLPKIETEYLVKPKRKSSLPVKTRKASRPDDLPFLVDKKDFKSICRWSKGEISDRSSPSTDIPIRTPEPEMFREFFPFSSVPTNCPYQPRYCWCTRCQMMYRMFKEDDRSLDTWGNYPCFRF